MIFTIIDTLTIYQINEMIGTFVYSRNREPEIIILHPDDAKVFVGIMHEKYGRDVMRIERADVIASFDVERGTCRIH